MTACLQRDYSTRLQRLVRFPSSLGLAIKAPSTASWTVVVSNRNIRSIITPLSDLAGIRLLRLGKLAVLASLDFASATAHLRRERVLLTFP